MKDFVKKNYLIKITSYRGKIVKLLKKKSFIKVYLKRIILINIFVFMPKKSFRNKHYASERKKKLNTHVYERSDEGIESQEKIIICCGCSHPKTFFCIILTTCAKRRATHVEMVLEIVS